MTLTGRQKAAMLLMALDSSTACDLLKGLGRQKVEEMAVEMAYLNASGYNGQEQSVEFAREFYNSLQPNAAIDPNNFLSELLKNTVGREQAGQIQADIQTLLKKRDPFMSIRSADSSVLALVLGKQHPGTIAVVLSELPPAKSSEVLGFLREEIRADVVSKMTASETATSEAKMRISQVVCRHLEAATVKGVGQEARKLRKVALMLRNLNKQLRDGLLSTMTEQDDKVGRKVADLMVIWSDIIHISDGPLKEALRGVDLRKLALALARADEKIVRKIKSNMTERAVASLEEETSLMSVSSRYEIEHARREVVTLLRQMNEKGKLTFIEA